MDLDSAAPLDPGSDEASQLQLHLARAQGDAFAAALDHMTSVIADSGGERRAGDYWVAYAIAPAEGLYEWAAGELRWREPGEANLHIEITVRDAGDGRFIPAARVTVTLIDQDGREIGTHEHPLLWHPMLYHFGRNWTIAGEGTYTLRVRVEPPTFMRHDRINGKRFTKPAEIEFTEVRIPRTARL